MKRTAVRAGTLRRPRRPGHPRFHRSVRELLGPQFARSSQPLHRRAYPQQPTPHHTNTPDRHAVPSSRLDHGNRPRPSPMALRRAVGRKCSVHGPPLAGAAATVAAGAADARGSLRMAGSPIWRPGRPRPASPRRLGAMGRPRRLGPKQRRLADTLTGQRGVAVRGAKAGRAAGVDVTRRLLFPRRGRADEAAGPRRDPDDGLGQANTGMEGRQRQPWDAKAAGCGVRKTLAVVVAPRAGECLDPDGCGGLGRGAAAAVGRARVRGPRRSWAVGRADDVATPRRG